MAFPPPPSEKDDFPEGGGRFFHKVLLSPVLEYGG